MFKNLIASTYQDLENQKFIDDNLELMLIKIVKETPNDQELGKKVRKLINSKNYVKSNKLLREGFIY